MARIAAIALDEVLLLQQMTNRLFLQKQSRFFRWHLLCMRSCFCGNRLLLALFVSKHSALFSEPSDRSRFDRARMGCTLLTYCIKTLNIYVCLAIKVV